MKKRFVRMIVSVIVLTMMLTGCGNAANNGNTPTSTLRPTTAASATPTTQPTEAEVATATPQPTEAEVATATPQPTEAEVATSTPQPTEAEVATATPQPTATAAATSTPTPQPTATSTPQPTATSTPTPRPTATSTPTPRPTATNGGATIELSSLEHQTNSDSAPVVYYISDITAEAMVKIYNALQWTPTGEVAVKLSTGEPPASNYLRPELIKDLVQLVDGTIVECNTAYGGSRASTALHYQVAADHGFTAIADVKILDEDGSMTLPVVGGNVLSENYVGEAFADYDSYLVLSHFKGHAMAGFGGAIKNISIGLGSSEGKCWIHSGGTSRRNPWGGAQDAFCESMADAGKSVSDYLGNGEQIVYINVMNRLSIDCDCDGNPSEPDMHDIGILASTDPVALDQACIDLVWVSEGNASFIRRVEGRNGLHTLESAESIGLGTRSYRIESLDD